MSATNTNSALLTVLGVGQPVTGHRPWLRFVVTAETWNVLLAGLAKSRWSLLGLWGEPGMVHLAAHEFETGTPGIASLPCPAGEFPSVGRWHPPAQRLERAIADLVGLQPAAGPDLRPWLDHGRWPLRHPLGSPTAPAWALPPYPFLPTEGESLHQIPVGPVHAGIIEPGHFRFTANGEAVVRLEERLGYVHKGIESLLNGASLERAARLVGRAAAAVPRQRARPDAAPVPHGRPGFQPVRAAVRQQPDLHRQSGPAGGPARRARHTGR